MRIRNDASIIHYGINFLRILCIAVAVYPLLFVIITVFQAVGDSVKPFILALLHKGIDIAFILYFIRFSKKKTQVRNLGFYIVDKEL